jgi:hypothetical protein
LRPVLGFVAATANELAPLLGFIEKATRASATSVVNLLANAHFLGD